MTSIAIDQSGQGRRCRSAEGRPGQTGGETRQPLVTRTGNPGHWAAEGRKGGEGKPRGGLQDVSH